MKRKADETCKNVLGKNLYPALKYTFSIFIKTSGKRAKRPLPPFLNKKFKKQLYRREVLHTAPTLYKNWVMLQHVFLKERPQDVQEQDSLLWCIPLIYLTPDNLDPSAPHDPVVWMNELRHVTIVNLPGPDFFIIVNPDEIGELSSMQQASSGQNSDYALSSVNMLILLPSMDHSEACSDFTAIFPVASLYLCIPLLKWINHFSL